MQANEVKRMTRTSGIDGRPVNWRMKVVCTQEKRALEAGVNKKYQNEKTPLSFLNTAWHRSWAMAQHLERQNVSFHGGEGG